MDTNRLLELFDQKSNRKVLVIVDTIVDRYIKGSKAKLSPEAPVTVVHGDIKKWTTPGGASNVLRAVARLAGQVYFMTLNGNSMEIQGMYVYPCANPFPNRVPPIKTRVVCNGHHICRYDEEDTYHMSNVDNMVLYEKLTEELYRNSPDSVILSDYGKSGVTSQTFTQILGAVTDYASQTGKLLCFVVDTKTPYEVIQRPDSPVELVITPNIHEWEAYLSRVGRVTCNTVITLGDGGIEYITLSNVLSYIRPFASPTVIDVCGAGDCVTATCGLLFDAFESLESRVEKLECAQLVAEESIQRFGVDPPFIMEVVEYAKNALRQA